MKENFVEKSRIQDERERAWIAAYENLEIDRLFRRARRRAFFASLRFSRSLPPSAERTVARCSGDSGRISLPVNAIAGFFGPDGRPIPGVPPMPRRLLAAWRTALREGGDAGLPLPQAREIDGTWFLQSGDDALLALELSRALGRKDLSALEAAPRQSGCRIDELPDAVPIAVRSNSRMAS